MKEFIYLDTSYLTSALAQINNGKIISYRHEGFNSSEDKTDENVSQLNSSKIEIGIPKLININFGNQSDSDQNTSVVDIQSAKEVLTKTFDDNAFDILLQYIKENKRNSSANYQDGDFAELNGEYELIDFDFILKLLDKDFVDLYIANSGNQMKSSSGTSVNNFRKQQVKAYKELQENVERFKKIAPSSMLLYVDNVLLPLKKEFLRDSFEDIIFKYKKINLLARITRRFEQKINEKNTNNLLKLVDYMIPSILDAFDIDLTNKNEIYIATPIAIYIG
jgi:hypothetical protein